MQGESENDNNTTNAGRTMILQGVLYGLAAIGLLFTLGVVFGVAADYAAFDPTSGGYEPPYENYSGEPLDWESEAYTTQTGMVKPGYVVDVHLDCRTGMLSFELVNGPVVDFRPLSDRALAVHEPREACQERGFDPEF